MARASDITTGVDLMNILSEEVSRLKTRQTEGQLDGADISNLERLSKVYHTLQTESREADKGLGKLSDEELLKLAEQTQDSSDPTDQ